MVSSYADGPKMFLVLAADMEGLIESCFCPDERQEKKRVFLSFGSRVSLVLSMSALERDSVYLLISL